MITYMRAWVATTATALGADEEGATAAEYVFLIVFIAIAAAIGMVVLGQGLLNVFNDTGTTVDATTPGNLPNAPTGPTN